MAGLASNQVIDYQGHAIMFGLDNNYHGNRTGGNMPSAVVEKPSNLQGIGNFVQAHFDVGAKTFTGDIYNAFIDPSRAPGAIVYDSLVTIDAKVEGNTIAGDAELTYNPADGVNKKGQIRGSFFGPTADEVGGSLSSVTSRENKVDGLVGWGGAFGAKRIDKGSVLGITDKMEDEGKKNK